VVKCSGFNLILFYFLGAEFHTMATKKKILCQRGLLGKTSSKFCHILKGKKKKESEVAIFRQ
jgi:hypothetical protein